MMLRREAAGVNTIAPRWSESSDVFSYYSGPMPKEDLQIKPLYFSRILWHISTHVATNIKFKKTNERRKQLVDLALKILGSLLRKIVCILSKNMLY